MDDLEVSLTIEEIDLQRFDRLDLYLVDKTGESRSRMKNYFESGLITSDYPLSIKKMPPIGTTIYLQFPEPIPTAAQAENLPLEILYQDEHLLFINKSAGMVTHPAPGNYTGTLVNAVLYHCPDLQAIGDQIRPGIVHRLDKGTSGVMVVAKNQKCHEGLVSLFSTHNIDRIYHCLAIGPECPIAGTLKSTIGRHQTNRLKMAVNVPGGREAVTHYRLLKKDEKIKYFEVTLETGRTHQIRVHLSQLLKQQILMDGLYGNPGLQLQQMPENWRQILQDYPHPLLHAQTLGLVHPITGEYLRFSAPPPAPFAQLLELVDWKIKSADK